MQEESAAFAMPCHAGRAKRPLTIAGPCRAKTLDRLIKSGLPRLAESQVPSTLPLFPTWCVHSIALHCIAVHGTGMASNAQGSAACPLIRRSPRPASTVQSRSTKTSPVDPEPWNAMVLHVLLSYYGRCEQRRHVFAHKGLLLSHCAARYTDVKPPSRFRSQSGYKAQCGASLLTTCCAGASSVGG